MTSPLIRSRLWTLMYWTIELLKAKNYLINSNLISSTIQLPGYYGFSKRIFFHLRDVGYQAAVPLIESDRNLFKSCGFNGDVLQGLARLQGIQISS